MRFKEFKTKAASVFNEEDEIDLVKSSLISLIGTLPKDDKTLNYLKQVQDTLKKQGVGSRVVGFLNAKSVMSKLDKIPDADRSTELDNKLASLIVTADGTTEDKRTFLALLIKDTLINTTKLFNSGKFNSLKDTITTYGSNPATTDIINKLGQAVGYGIGPGEILLVALSRKLSKEGSGDLTVGDPVNGVVELKTFNKKGPRFFDRSTPVGADYNKANQEFIKLYGKAKDSGWNAQAIHTKYKTLPPAKKIQFKTLVTRIINSSYPNAELSTKNELIASSLDNPTKANFLAGQASFENYKTIKNFKGYLFLSLQSFSTFYFNEFNDINAAGLTWNIQTAYFIDKGGENYHAPQLNILPSK
jgi:hypothetical protein